MRRCPTSVDAEAAQATTDEAAHQPFPKDYPLFTIVLFIRVFSAPLNQIWVLGLKSLSDRPTLAPSRIPRTR